MRLYQELDEAVSEITRDLFKSPTVHSTRVQHVETDVLGHEAMNYMYTIPTKAIPEKGEDLAAFGAQHFPYWDRHYRNLLEWLNAEKIARDEGPVLSSKISADLLHPDLQKLMEGNHFSYTYAERLIGADRAISRALFNNPDTRRAFWPIFQPLDGIRAAELTRIPCSIGYQVVIREVPGQGPRLHLTYIQRSSDFARFWLSDVWFATRFQRNILQEVRYHYPELQLGHFSHIILSFHHFLEDKKEIY